MDKYYFLPISIKLGVLTIVAMLAGVNNAAIAQGTKSCESENAIISANYEGAGMGRCTTFVPSIFRVVIEPEEEGGGSSPWYSFKVTSKIATPLVVDMVYVDGEHRFDPKISYDGITWDQMSDNMYREIDSERLQFYLPASDKPFYISAHDIFANDRYETWMNGLVAKGAVTKTLLGVSELKRPIYKIESKSEVESDKYLFLIGRQHPAEVNGAFAMTSFVNAVFSDSELARNFRREYNVVAVPQVNPDGVALGHWRYGTGGIDLNHDWSQFTQAETKVVGEEIAKYVGDKKLELFIDFHSTGEHLLYTQPGKQNEWPSRFTQRWTNGVKARVDWYDYYHEELDYPERDPDNVSGTSATRFAYNKTGSTNLVYESSETDDSETASMLGTVVAEEIMRTLLLTGTN